MLFYMNNSYLSILRDIEDNFDNRGEYDIKFANNLRVWDQAIWYNDIDDMMYLVFDVYVL